MIDDVTYVLPFGILGKLVKALYVGSQVEHIFNERAKLIDEYVFNERERLIKEIFNSSTSLTTHTPSCKVVEVP